MVPSRRDHLKEARRYERVPSGVLQYESRWLAALRFSTERLFLGNGTHFPVSGDRRGVFVTFSCGTAVYRPRGALAYKLLRLRVWVGETALSV